MTSHAAIASASTVYASLPPAAKRCEDAQFRALRKGLEQAVGSSTSKEELLAEVGRLVGAACPVELLSYVGRDGDKAAARWVGLVGYSTGLNEDTRELLADCVNKSWSRADIECLRLPGAPDKRLTAVPVALRDHPLEALIALTSDRSCPTQSLLATLLLAANSVTAWHTDHSLARADSECRSTAAIVELVEKMQSEPDLPASCQCLADHLQQLLACQQVIVGVCGRRKRSCRVLAISESLDIDARSERIRCIEAAMDESIVRQSLTVWPSPNDSERHALLANQCLAKSTSSGNVVSVPVRDGNGKVQGACVFLGDEGLSVEPQNLNLIRAAERPIGSCLAQQQRAQRGRVHRFVSNIANWPREWPGRVGLAAALLVAGLMMVPFPYKVKCNCELQPVTRRFVAAPFEGTLEESMVEPGDLVAREQLLALIDGREIRWELAGISADLNRAAKKRDGHLASHEFGEAKLSQYDVERLQVKSELLELRNDNLEIRSPIDGIVITGDLKKTEGAPLRVGQTLYEIAPLDQMIVEVAIPEDEISRVTPGLSVDLTLEAFPGEHWQGELVRIHPRSEVKDDEHVFIGEMELENSDELLRPGMQGRVRITSRRRPLGWILLHKPWDKLVFWLGW